MAESPSQVGHLVNIITSPSAVFSPLKQQPKIIFPLLLLIVLSVAVISSYYALVDYPWAIDQMVSAKSEGLSTDEREAMRKAMESMPKSVMAGSSIAGAAIVMPIILMALAAYLLLVNKLIDKQNLGFKHWFSLVCWTSIPAIFTSVASLSNILLAENGQLALDEINPVNLNSLLFHFPASEALAGPLTAIDPFTLWAVVLLALGYRQWTGSSLASSVIIACAPTVIIYGIWIAIAAL
jgi:hypothetical protein